ncbi:MAG: RsmB/NOP family class I SAM-dependent RNA methyltransferase [Vampirovibrionales bacterium]|jgi:16S rRNA (cytosine967-C5)-methyltransferase|nr:RsmB/NOP family class I SAM-dependent RNA methyltransferase [Vampirovibrionales bacterium]
MSRSFPSSVKNLTPSSHALALLLIYGMDLGIFDKADDALYDALSHAPFDRLTPQERGLATMLVNESLRWSLTLKSRIKTLTKKRFKDLQAPLRHLLLLGLLSVLHPQEREKERTYSQVQAWVELAKACKLAPAQVGMLNACLRRASEELAPLGDVEANFKGTALERQSLASGWPTWALKELQQATDPETVDAYIQASHHKQPMSVFHTQAQSEAEMHPVLETLALQGIKTQQPFLPDFPQAIHLEDALKGGITTLPDWDAGAWYVQDYGSAWVARHAWEAVKTYQDPVVVDLCAAPGSKTWWLAKAVEDGGHVHAVDVSAKRLERLTENMTRLKLNDRVSVHTADATTFTLDTPADVVLVDAPCSALGTISHHPDLWMNRSEASLKEFPPLQLAILSQAASVCHESSILIYSTCTWRVAENQRVIEAFLKTHLDWRLVEDHTLSMTALHDSFYVAILHHFND